MSEIINDMKSQMYGLVGIATGLLAFLCGLGQKTDLGGILLLSGVFIFGCGLVAAAIGAKR